ncbi:hypothetical protein BTVI_150819 [Pitangus sulphuratus]|nr:hypothetical protein BTVI_150819 [Pitangus sulphuratus]
MSDTAEQLSTGNSVTLPSLAYTSACRRSHANYRYRKAFVTNSLQHLQQELKSASTEPAVSRVEPQLVFVFCGNGVTLKKFSEALLSSEPVFRDKCKEIEDLFRQHTDISALPTRDHSPQDLLNPELSQRLLFTLQVAVASLLKYWGIKAVAAVGHSVGEVAAAHIAGYLSLADAVQVIYHRSRLQAKTASGRMLVVGNIPVQEIAERLHPYSGKVCIAAFNSPVSCTLSGNADSMETVQRELAQAFRHRNIFLHVLNVPAAYHSPSMDMILEELEEKIEPLGKQKGEIEVISTLTGVAASENDFARGKFWARHTREPVAFSQAIQTAARDRENVVFVEISPHRALQRSIKETLGKGTKVFSSLETDAEYQTLLTLLNEDLPNKVVDQLAKCCEAYRQVVVALREKTSRCSVRVITYRTTERYIDHVNCGFALYGMTRTCIVEVPEITFQLIDLSSCSSLDISVLADVLVKCRGGDYPEVCISQGRLYVSEIRRTPFVDTDYIQPVRSLQKSQTFTLYTSDPYTVTDLSGELSTSTSALLDKQSVEIQVDKICVHSEDYFPISVSSCNFGNTLYWNSQAGGKHRLLALDFSGTVTATGTDVKKVKVGDHVVSCYPTAASSRVQIPGIVCFNVKKFPLFQNVPCLSYFIIAWEIFTQRLPKGKHGRTLGIITTEPLSVLCHVLCAAAEEMGWRTVLARPTPDKFQYINLCNALVVLPPVNRLSREDLAHMYFLKDVVIVCGNRQSECIQNVSEIGHENISFHILTLASVFQKAPLKELQKTVHVWISSMDMKQFRRLSGSVFQQTDNFERLNSQEEMKALQQQYKGSKVVFVQCDVTLTGDVEKAFRSIANTFVGSPIKGVFQGAVALHDGHLEVLTLADFQKVLSPKVAGTLNLHWATRGQELDYFVCYSSVTSFLGNATQTNYAAANSFLDAFCLYRRNRGLSGQSINWGALNLGILLNQNHIQSILGSKGIDILQVHEIHEYLRKSLLTNNAQQAVIKLNFQVLYHHVFTRISSLKTRFISLVSEDFRNKLESPEETQVPDTAFLKSEDYVTSLVSDLTGLNPEELTMNTSLSSLGIDSMLAMTIQNRVFQERKVDIPLLKLLDPHTTLSSLVVVLEETSNAKGVVEKKNSVVERAENESRL